MGTDPQKQKVEFDLSDTERADRVLISFFNKLATGMEASAVKMKSLNEKNEFGTIQFKAFDAAGRQFIATMHAANREIGIYIDKAGKLQRSGGGFASPKDLKITRVEDITPKPIYNNPTEPKNINEIPLKYFNAWARAIDKKNQMEREAYAEDMSREAKKLVILERNYAEYGALQTRLYQKKVREEDALNTKSAQYWIARTRTEEAANARSAQFHLAAMRRSEMLNSQNAQYQMAAMRFETQQETERVRRINNFAKSRQASLAQEQKQISAAHSEALKMDKAMYAPSAADKFLNRAYVITSGIIISQIFMKVISDITGAINEAAKFEVKISEIRTLSQQAQLSTSEWTKEIRGLASAFGADVFDVTEGVYQALSNQIAKGAEVTRFMNDAMRFAAVTVSTTTESVNLLSSAINAYHLGVNDTAAVSATFFKLIDLGRVRAGEMSNAIGGTIAMTAQLGISIEDTSAFLGVATRQGVAFANASTYLRNITTTLLKPSEKMKEVFKEWGVSSGQAAIQTFGLIGVLGKLSAIADHGGLEEIAQDLKNMKTIQGVSLVASPENIKQLMIDTEKYKHAQVGYAETVSMAFESAGKQFAIFWAQVKQFFLFDFGTKFVDTFGAVVKWLGNFDGMMSKFSTTIKMGAMAWVVYGAATGSIANKLKILWAVVGDLYTGISRFAVANPYLAAGMAVAAIATYIYTTSKSIEEQLEEVMEKAKKTAEEINRYELERIAKNEARLKESLDKNYQRTLSVIAQTRVGYQDFFDFFEKKLGDIKEATKETVDTFKEAFNEGLSSVKNNVSKLTSLMKDAEKHFYAFMKQNEAKNFEDSIEELPPVKRIKAEIERAISLRKEAEGLQAGSLADITAGDTEGAEEKIRNIRTLNDEARQLLNKAQQEDKSMLKDAVSHIKNKELRTKMYDELISKQNLWNVTLKEEQAIKTNTYTQDQLIYDLAKKQAGLKQEQENVLKKTKVQLFDQFKQFEGIKVDKKDDAASIQKKIDMITKLQADVGNAMTSNVGVINFADSINLNKQLEEKKGILLALVESQEKLNKLNEDAMELEKGREELTKTFNQNNKARQELAAGKDGKVGMGKLYAESIESFRKIEKGFGHIIGPTDDISNLINVTGNDSSIMQKQVIIDKILKLTDAAKAKLGPLPDGAELGTFLEQTNSAATQFQKLFTEDQTLRSKNTVTQLNLSLMKDKIKELEDVYKNTFNKNADAAKGSFQKTEQNFNNLIDNIKIKIKELDELDNKFDFKPEPKKVGLNTIENGVQVASTQGSTRNINSTTQTRSTTFGNIIVNVNNSNPGSIDARQLAINIRREFVRGTVPQLT